MILLEPIGVVGSARREMEDDNWGEVVSAIEIFDPPGEESLAGIDDFSHVEVIFFFHRVEEQRIVTGARHPRNNPRWPKTGILAQRAKNRPNRLGLSVARIR